MYFKETTSFQVNKVLLLLLCSHSLPCKLLVFSLWWRRLKNVKFKTPGESISTDLHKTRSTFSQLELDLPRVPVFLSKVLNQKKQRISPSRAYVFPMDTAVCASVFVGSSLGSRDIAHVTCLKGAQPESSKYSFEICVTTKKGMESHTILTAAGNWPL